MKATLKTWKIIKLKLPVTEKHQTALGKSSRITLELFVLCLYLVCVVFDNWQLIAHWIRNRIVPGSNPIAGTWVIAQFLWAGNLHTLALGQLSLPSLHESAKLKSSSALWQQLALFRLLFLLYRMTLRYLYVRHLIKHYYYYYYIIIKATANNVHLSQGTTLLWRLQNSVSSRGICFLTREIYQIWYGPVIIMTIQVTDLYSTLVHFKL